MDPSLPARRMNLRPDGGLRDGVPVLRRRTACSRRTARSARKGTRRTQVGGNSRPSSRSWTRTRCPTGDADGRKLGEALATTGVIAAMYDEGAWPQLREALTSAMKENDGAGLLVLSDSYYERDADGRYANLMFANAAVNCLDLPPAFSGPDRGGEGAPGLREGLPGLRRGPRLGLPELRVLAGEGPRAQPHRIEAKGAAPIVVVGTTRDPATPYRWAQSLAGQLSSGPPPHLRGRRPHRLRPRQRPASTPRSTRTCCAAPPDQGKALLLARCAGPAVRPPGAGTEHPRKLCRLADVADRTMVRTARRLSSDGQSNALVMRRSRVRIPKAALWKPQDSLAVTWGFFFSLTLESGPIGHLRSMHRNA